MISREEAEAILKKHGQMHLLNHFDSLDEQKQKKLLSQIENIDFDLIESLYKKAGKKVDTSKDEISPVDYTDKSKLYDDYKKYENIGANFIKAGKYAAVTMAGGQGTRLGHDGPKGTYDIGLDSHKSLFELLCDNLKEAEKKYGVRVPWFIMTSEENNDETVEFFKKNKFFGYEKDKDLFFFKQGQLPMIDTEGKVLIGEDGLIKLAADGHGGVYEALVKNGMTDKMREMGVERVFIGGIDNCLAKMADPVFIGLAEENEVSVACKSVKKANADEKVGVICLDENGRPMIIEYSEIPEELARATNEEGELELAEANILNILLSLDAIEEVGKSPLPYHAAFKKAPYMDLNGDIVEPDSPNAYKFEAFMFDILQNFDKILVLRVKRKHEFAPVKNADSAGVDCPSTAKALYERYQEKLQGQDIGF